jgi:hypothetical protein
MAKRNEYRIADVVKAHRDDIAADILVAFYLDGDDQSLDRRIVRMKQSIANKLRSELDNALPKNRPQATE